MAKSYVITLPRGVDIDIFNLPNNFEEIVLKCFEEYTDGTSKEYTYVDKLGFIDRFIERLNKSVDAEDCVNDLVKRRFEYEWHEQGELLTEEDIYCQEFMWDCFELGRDSAKLESHFNIDNHHIYDEIQKILVKVITIVMNY